MNKNLIIFPLALFMHACGGGVSNPNTTNPPLLSFNFLIALSSDLDLINYLQNDVDKAQSEISSTAATLESSKDSSSSNTFSTTYTMEVGIDEHDVMKYNGSLLVTAPSRSIDCCFILPMPEDMVEQNASDQLSDEESKAIKIFSVEPDTADFSLQTSVSLNIEESVEGIYLNDKNLITLSSSTYHSNYGDDFSMHYIWEDQITKIFIHDVSDPASVTQSHEIELNGGLVSSRLMNNQIYVFLRHTPSTFSINEGDATKVLPKISIDSVSSDLISPDKCFILNENNDEAVNYSGYPVITAVLKLNLSDLNYSASCFIGSLNGIYFTEEFFFYTQTNYSSDATRTAVHQFDTPTLNYLGSGTTDGYLFAGGNADFRINYFDNTLRIVTTDYPTISSGGSSSISNDPKHQLTVFSTIPQDKVMNRISILPNSLRPDQIGKPNEELYGVRFLGTKAYFVTYERIDPFYVIDLSDPEDPYIAGELIIPGFSNFIHPVTEKLMLGLGPSENSITKLELFDVSDLNNPRSRSVLPLEIGDSWSSSEAEYNRHAFTYLPFSESLDRFTIPIESYDQNSGSILKLHLLEIRDKDQPENTTIFKVGEIDTKNFSRGPSRSVIDGDAVYFSNETNVWSTLWSDPSVVKGPK